MTKIDQNRRKKIPSLSLMVSPILVYPQQRGNPKTKAGSGMHGKQSIRININQYVLYHNQSITHQNRPKSTKNDVGKKNKHRTFGFDRWLMLPTFLTSVSDCWRYRDMRREVEGLSPLGVSWPSDRKRCIFSRTCRGKTRNRELRTKMKKKKKKKRKRRNWYFFCQPF